MTNSDLTRIVRAIENEYEQIQPFKDAIKEHFKEAKESGYDTKAIRRLIRDRKKSDHERNEEDSIYEVYVNEVGYK